jgi:hypothetical protein
MPAVSYCLLACYPNVDIKIPTTRNKSPVELNRLHFLKLYPLSNVPLRGQASTAWEPSKQEKYSLALSPEK